MFHLNPPYDGFLVCIYVKNSVSVKHKYDCWCMLTLKSSWYHFRQNTVFRWNTIGISFPQTRSKCRSASKCYEILEKCAQNGTPECKNRLVRDTSKASPTLSSKEFWESFSKQAAWRFTTSNLMVGFLFPIVIRLFDRCGHRRAARVTKWGSQIIRTLLDLDFSYVTRTFIPI